MDRLRSSHSLLPSGLLLGVLLVVCPVLQTALGTCAKQPDRTDAPAVVSVVEQSGASQWTCDDQGATPAVRAVSSERPDVPSHGGGADTATNTSPRWPLIQTEKAPQIPSGLPFFLTALRPVVLQI